MEDVGSPKSNFFAGLKSRFNVSLLCALYNIFLVVWMIISFVVSAVAYMTVQAYRLSVDRLRCAFLRKPQQGYEAEFCEPDEPVQINRRRPAA